MISRSNNVTLSNLRIEGCKRDSNWGVLDIDDSSDVFLNNMQCIGNKNAAGPSCISGWSTICTIRDMLAEKNVGGYGGVMKIGYSTLTIEGGNFTKNRARFTGGGAYVENSILLLAGTVFDGNEAYEDGGALTIQV